MPPAALTHLQLDWCNLPLDELRLLESLRMLPLSKQVSEPLTTMAWAPQLHTLHIGAHFFQPLAVADWMHSLLESLTELLLTHHLSLHLAVFVRDSDLSRFLLATFSH